VIGLCLLNHLSPNKFVHLIEVCFKKPDDLQLVDQKMPTFFSSITWIPLVPLLLV